MATLAGILLLILNVIFWIVLIHIIMSWLINFQVLNLSQPLVARIWDGLERLVQPVYAKIRRYLPDTGALDLAPLVVILAIYILRIILVDIRYGAVF